MYMETHVLSLVITFWCLFGGNVIVRVQASCNGFNGVVTLGFLFAVR
jgi:hypothetical protein